MQFPKLMTYSHNLELHKFDFKIEDSSQPENILKSNMRV